MIALIQRVASASVEIAQRRVANIDAGLLAFIAVTPADTEARADRLLERLLGYRVFADEAGRMNHSLRDRPDCGLLLVPQFTLAADTQRGNRPGFSRAAPPELGKSLFEYLCTRATALYARVQRGEFGADMKVALINDGPVTFWLEDRKNTPGLDGH